MEIFSNNVSNRLGLGISISLSINPSNFYMYYKNTLFCTMSPALFMVCNLELNIKEIKLEFGKIPIDNNNGYLSV